MAVRDLDRGMTLDASMLEAAEVPSSFVPPGAMETISEVAGRVLSSDITAGEVLTASRVAVRAAGPIAALVGPGLRAVVVPAGIPATTVRAGDLIDCWRRSAAGGRTPKPWSRPPRSSGCWPALEG